MPVLRSGAISTGLRPVPCARPVRSEQDLGCPTYKSHQVASGVTPISAAARTARPVSCVVSPHPPRAPFLPWPPTLPILSGAYCRSACRLPANVCNGWKRTLRLFPMLVDRGGRNASDHILNLQLAKLRPNLVYRHLQVMREIDRLRVASTGQLSQAHFQSCQQRG